MPGCPRNARVAGCAGGDPMTAQPHVPRVRAVQHHLPQLRDCPDARALAEFYRELLGLRYRPGDEPPAAGQPDPRGQDYLALRDAGGRPCLAVAQVPDFTGVTWPGGPQNHAFCLTPSSIEGMPVGAPGVPQVRPCSSA